MENGVMDTRTSFETSNRLLSDFFEGDPIYNIFEMLYETKDIKTTINMILDLVGKRFKVDRVYIFEHSEDCKYSSNTYEWCAKGIKPEIETLQNISVNDLEAFFARYNQDGIFYCNVLSSLDPFSIENLGRQGIKSFLHCAIYEEGIMKGFIGFDDCTKERVWEVEEVALLSYISRILSIFILKRQISKGLLSAYQNNTEMLESINGYVYVIDLNNYQMLYVNREMKKLGVQIGEKCHKMAFGSDKPCENCPVRLLNDATPFASEEVYSIKINSWVNSSASKLKWSGKIEAALVCCVDITKYKNLSK